MSKREWPPYNPAAKCPKCGNDDVGSLYREGWVYRIEGSGEGEWVQRTCRRCHFEWPEECTDGDLPLVPCPARVDAVLGFLVPTSVPCGLLKGHSGRHEYRISWLDPSPSPLAEEATEK